MTITQRNVFKEALNLRFLSLVQVESLSVQDAYQKIVGENTYALTALPVSNYFIYARCS